MTTVTVAEPPRGHRSPKEPGQTGAHWCLPRRTKERKEPGSAQRGKAGARRRQMVPFCLKRQRGKDAAWESPQNKPSVRCEARAAAAGAR